MKSIALLLLPLMLAGCGMPRDPEGTRDRIAAERQFAVGLIARGPDELAGDDTLVARVAAATGARPMPTRGSTEQLLAMLEAGDLDLVVGPLDAKSPWRDRVTLIGPLAERVDRRGASRQLWAAARNGENDWIMLVERAAHDLKDGRR